ncbi:hypothetical protein CSPX01_15719 [Colletotrichum filicis]|nr:hypothetical protein CSPX01_15719 [Colletotrichum filicis]
MRPSQFRQPSIVVYWFSLKSSQGRYGVIAPNTMRPVPGTTAEGQVDTLLPSSCSLFQEPCTHTWCLAKPNWCLLIGARFNEIQELRWYLRHCRQSASRVLSL